jgi:oligopeptide/dipeptide ABC transporter ATP-binding protein
VSEPLLRVENLVKHFPVTAGLFGREAGRVRAVDGVSFEIQPGETLGLVGESGCGKTTVGRTVLRLLEPTSGRIVFAGEDLTALPKAALRARRRQMQIVFQDPMSSLNPRMTVRDIVGEALAVHGIARGAAMDGLVVELLEKVGIPGAWRDRYPHEFSGGQRQRIGVARAIALSPKLVVCDEAVSALDVSVQAQVLNLLLRLREEMGLAYLFIAHDLSVVKHLSHRIAVMYLGQIVELADTRALFREPVHPYTRALLSAIPVPDPTRQRERIVLPGDVPSPIHPPAGCRFHTRCPAVMERCRRDEPPTLTLPGGHTVKCFLAQDLPAGVAVTAEIDRRAAEAMAANRARLGPVPAVAPAPLPVRHVRRERRSARPVTVALGVLLTAALVLPLLLAGPLRTREARRQWGALSAEIEGFARNTGSHPARLEDLGWRLFSVSRDGRPLDPWGRAWRYQAGEGAAGFALGSFGADGAPGGGDDVGSPPSGAGDEGPR